MGDVAVDQLGKHPILNEFCKPLPRLMDDDAAEVSGSVSRFGELLRTRPDPISLGFRIIGETVRYWRLAVDPQGFRVDEEPADDEQSIPVDIEVIADQQTWLRIAGSEISPMTAMLAGQMRFRGDVALARRVVQQLHRAPVNQSEKV